MTCVKFVENVMRGFDVIVDPNSQSPDLVIAFSFSGQLIPAESNGVLTNIVLNTLSTELKN